MLNRITGPLRLVSAVLLTGLVVGCGSDTQAPPVAPPDTVQPPPPPPPGLPAGIHVLAGVGAALPHTDLAPLRGIVGNARFVALGESTHASRGFNQAKLRMIRYMVEELGYRALAFESPWLEARVTANYVATCSGSPEAAIRGLFRIWRDEIVRDLLYWLCEYNRRNPADPVIFYGFDIQEPWASAPAVLQFIAQASPADTVRAVPLRRCLGAAYPNDTFFLSDEWRDHAAGRRDTEAHEACIAALDATEAWVAGNRAQLESATSPGTVEEARLSLVALRAWQLQVWVPDPGGYQARDFGMAELARRLQALHAPGRKTMIWAWNWHIARRYEEMRGFDDDSTTLVPRQTARAMGSFMHDALGADYVTIGLIGYDVNQPFGIRPPLQTHPRSVERRLYQLNQPLLLVDLRQPLPDVLPPGETYRISQEWGDPYRQFDAVVYMVVSPAAVLYWLNGMTTQ
jgi:erythromycin esterase-like protein